MLIIAAVLLMVAWGGWRWVNNPRNQDFVAWRQGSQVDREALITAQREPCPGARFILPADGFIGLLYEDPRGPYSVRSPHQGIDIFSDSEPGVTPVYAAYDGYVTREESWRSTLIIRIPQDPLQPDRQIWLYYTHMADQNGKDFIQDVFPPAVTLSGPGRQLSMRGGAGKLHNQSGLSIFLGFNQKPVRSSGFSRFPR